MMVNSDPFAPVELRPVMYEGKETDKMHLVMKSEETGGWVDVPHMQTKSAKYVLVPNEDVHQMALDIMARSDYHFKPLPAAQTKANKSASEATHWDGSRRYVARWYTEDVKASGPNGQAIAMGFQAGNSYDGKSVSWQFFAMNLLCSNQMVSQNILQSFSFRHTDTDAGIRLMDNVNDALGQISQAATTFSKVIPAFGEMSKKKMEFDDFLEFRSRVNDKGWARSRDADVLDEMYDGRITSELGLGSTASPDNLWGVLNAYTAVATHKIGGFAGPRASERAVDAAFEYV